MNSRIRLFFISLLAFALLGAACSKTPAQKDSATASQTAARSTIVFMTDFGTANDAVAICRAVIVGIAPDARLMDITHQVTPFQIEEASRFLAGVTPYYPAGTVFLVVVDPGVGTSRKAVAVKSKKGQYFVLPDNGIISPVIDRDGLDSAREITNPNWMIQAAVSSTFHGRDIFSPAAAHLAAGTSSGLRFRSSFASLRSPPPPPKKASTATSSASTIPTARSSPTFPATNSRNSATTSATRSRCKSIKNQ